MTRRLRPRALRQAMGLDQYLFARLLGVHHTSVYRWEQENNAPLEGLVGEIFHTLSKQPPSVLAALGRRLQPELAGNTGWRARLQILVEGVV